MIFRFTVCILFITFILIPSLSVSAQNYLPLSDVKVGMKCYGYSVFSGNELERMEIELTGVMTGGSKYNSMILAKVDSPSVRRGGIMSGMSGSPVYFGDKLVGAISSAYPYAKEPVCGITPIESMTRLWDLEKAPGRYIPKIPRHDILSRPDSDTINQLLPIGLSVNVRGFPSSGTMIPGLTGECVSTLQTNNDDSWGEVSELKPGSSIGVGLITGDMEMIAFGTVTEVIENRILAFGHQFFGLGKCNIPMLASKVVTFISNNVVSFKLSNAGPQIGSIIFDANSGVAGVTDSFARTIPVKITIEGLTPEPEIYSINAVDNEFLSSIFIAQAVSGAIRRLGVPWGDLYVETNLEIRLDDDNIIRQHDFFGSVDNVSGIISKKLSVLEKIQQNPLKPVVVKAVSIDCKLAQQARIVTLDSVRIPKKKYTAGDTVTVMMTFNGDRTGEFTRSIQVRIPQKIKSDKYSLYVLDAETYKKLKSLKRLPAHRSASYEKWLESMNDYLSGDQLIIFLAADSRDIRTDRFILPNLPPSMRTVMNNKVTGNYEIKSYRLIASEKLNMEFQVMGSSKLPIQIGPNNGV